MYQIFLFQLFMGFLLHQECEISKSFCKFVEMIGKIKILLVLLVLLASASGCGDGRKRQYNENVILDRRDYEDHDTLGAKELKRALPHDFERKYGSNDDVVGTLPDSLYFALITLTKNRHSILLVTDTVMRGESGLLMSSRADVFASNNRGAVREVGYIYNGDRSRPLVANDSVIYCVGDSFARKFYITEWNSSLGVLTEVKRGKTAVGEYYTIRYPEDHLEEGTTEGSEYVKLIEEANVAKPIEFFSKSAFLQRFAGK